MDVMFLPPTAWMRDVDEVESRVASVCGYLNAMHGRLVELVVEVLERDLWAQSGVRSPEHWCTWQTGVSHAAAIRIVAAARRFREFPVTMAALVAGELSLDQVSPIVNRAPAWADATICEIARCATVSQIRTAVAGYPNETGPDPEPEPVGEPVRPDDGHGPADPHLGEGIDHPDLDPSVPERFSLIQDPSGRWRISGMLDADHGAIVDAALREVADAMFQCTGHRPSRAAALIELARHNLVGICDPARRDRYRVHYLLDEHRQLVDPMGHTLPVWLRELICCDPDIAVTWQRHGIPIAHNRVSSTIDAATRRHIRRRDGGRCRVPGCGNPVTDFHHIVHREHHGSNHPSNIALICPRDHRAHHRGHLGITGDAEVPDGLVFTDRHGRVVAPNQLIRPPTEPPPEPAGTYRHPVGEALDTRWIDYEPPEPRAGRVRPEAAPTRLRAPAG